MNELLNYTFSDRDIVGVELYGDEINLSVSSADVIVLEKADVEAMARFYGLIQ